MIKRCWARKRDEICIVGDQTEGHTFSCLLFVMMLLVNSWVIKFMAWIPFDISKLLHLSPEYAQAYISFLLKDIYILLSLVKYIFMYLYIYVWLCLASLALNYKFLSLLVWMYLQKPVPTIHYPSKLIVELGYRRNLGLDHKCTTVRGHNSLPIPELHQNRQNHWSQSLKRIRLGEQQKVK